MFPLMPIGWILMMMEIVGMKADLDRNAELDKLYVKRVEQLDSRLHNYAAVKQLQKEADREILERAFEHVKAYKKQPKNFKKKVFEIYHKNSKPVNLNSPDERRKLIFNILNYEVLKYTKIGKVRLANEDIPDEERWQLASTERWIIEELAKKHKSKLLLDMIKRGEYSSAHSKYILPLEPRWVGTDGRVHSNHLPHGTKTGRPSSQDPNLYNLPARSSLTPELMSQFVPRNKHYVIVRQDSKQIELRLIADRAQDKTMIAEFNAGKDPHRMAAQAAYGYTEEEWAELPEELQKALRSNAKNAVSFGLVYGREAEALAVDFGWRVSKAEDFKSKYFGKYYGIKEYLEEETERIREACLSISHYNRHRRLPEAQSEDIGKANHAIREGINAPIQGDASDINIIAAYRMQRWCMKNEMKTRVINFVYDAVYLDAYRKELPVVVPKLHFFMTDRDFLYKMAGWKLRVPLDTDCEIGEKNMGAMTGLEHTKVPGQFVIPKAFLKN